MHSAPDAIVLCGGAGLRLRSVTGDAPKSMANVAERPFLELLFKQLQRNGFSRVILAAGYQGNQIRSHFGEYAFGIEVAYSVESSPLGTGGAIRNAADLIQSDMAVVMNGDSYTDADLGKLLSDHRQSGADMSLAVVQVDGRNDHGSVQLTENRRVLLFAEKCASSDSLFLNAGIYVMPCALIHEIPPERPSSLEKDLIPGWLAEGKHIHAFVHVGRCVDIGTPERYQSAQHVLANAEAPAGFTGESQR